MRYTPKEKSRAVGLAVALGDDRAAEITGLNRRTINYWRHLPEFEELRSKTRDALADELWAAIGIGVAEVAKGLLGEASLRDKATALGILYDKHALLTGAATSRTEARDLTGTLSDADLIAAVREVDALARGERTPPPPPTATAAD